MRILSVDGYRAATMARIQAESGLSRGLVGYHFGSKQNLMEAVVTKIHENFVAQTAGADPAPGLDGFGEVSALFEAYLGRLSARPQPAKVMIVLATESMSGATEVRQALQEALAGLRDRFAHMLERGLEDGSVRATIDPQSTGAVLQGMLRGIVLQFLVDEDNFDLDGAKRAAKEALTDWIAAS